MDMISTSTKPISPVSNLDLFGFLLVLLIWEVGSEPALYKVFLNSYGHCGHDKSFNVRPDQVYGVRADVSPNTGTKSFRDCETNFYSPEENGRLCVVQEGKLNEISDHNAQLMVHDGHDTDDSPIIFSLSYNQGFWAQREYCTKTPYINFYLRKIDKNIQVDIRKVYIHLKVVDIESRSRALYLDEMYCNGSYPLQNSLLSVYNRAVPDLDVSHANLTHVCSLKLEKDKNENRSICFVYVPTSRFDCSSDWLVSIFSDLQNVAYKLRCRDEKAKQMHAWCGNNMTHSLTLNFQRMYDATWDLPLEVPEMFRYVFADHLGSPDSLMEKVKRELLKPIDSSGLEVGWIVLIVLAVILLLAVLAVLYWKRAVLPCVQYKAVHNPGNAASV